MIDKMILNRRLGMEYEIKENKPRDITDEENEIEDEEYMQLREEVFGDLVAEIGKIYLEEKRRIDPTFELPPLSCEEQMRINDYVLSVLKFKRPIFAINELDRLREEAEKQKRFPVEKK